MGQPALCEDVRGKPVALDILEPALYLFVRLWLANRGAIVLEYLLHGRCDAFSNPASTANIELCSPVKDLSHLTSFLPQPVLDVSTALALLTCCRKCIKHCHYTISLPFLKLILEKSVSFGMPASDEKVRGGHFSARLDLDCSLLNKTVERGKASPGTEHHDRCIFSVLGRVEVAMAWLHGNMDPIAFLDFGEEVGCHTKEPL